MDKVHIADNCNDNRLEGAGSETLNNSADEKDMIIICGTTNDCSNDTHHTRKQEYRSFSIFARESTDEWTSCTDNEKLISSELGNSRNAHTEID